ncbi:MAG: efflux RND transporter periplasmic adaptor subunit [Terriglobia bacterium]|jgi:RND family efflux transporter MFP subunit|nr:efflux RND transporter periplasmic adaptor subunit [Terriglobia bacterium]
MVRKSVILIVVVVAVSILGFIYRGKIVATFQSSGSGQAASRPSTPPGERKVLYWYDAMNPTHTYDKPGKAPDGMDLVPKYADDGGGTGSTDQQSVGSAPPGERKVLYWYDAMNPTHHYDKPGKAPDGMDLIPQYAEDSTAGPPPAGTVHVDTRRQQLIGVRMGTVEREPLVRTVRTTGQLTADETRIEHVHVKINGYIDKVYVDYVGQLVKKGQPLFTVYSPDLVATQEEYLIAKRGDKAMGKSDFKEVSQGAQSLLDSARQRLKLWDISDDQIKKLDETGEVSKYMTFYSPVSGFVMDRKAFPQTAITPDMDLYQITDLSKIWVNADIYEYEVPFVKIGQTADMNLSYYAGKTYTGKITYIYPTVDPISRTVRVRIEFPNPKFELKPQMFANVSLQINYGTQVVVPQEAVLDSGNEQVVFVARGDGYFEPRKIRVGPSLDGKVVVLAGLKPGESIVTSGNFLIDSESQLKDAMGGMKH